MSRVPWHPAIVHFPVACWMAAALLDVAAWMGLSSSIAGIELPALTLLLLWSGVVLALPAMAAGLVDVTRLPRTVQQSEVLAWHIGCMASAWSLFLLAGLWRTRAGSFESAVSGGMVLLELLAASCVVIGGHLAAIVVFQRLPAALGKEQAGAAAARQPVQVPPGPPARPGAGTHEAGALGESSAMH